MNDMNHERWRLRRWIQMYHSGVDLIFLRQLKHSITFVSLTQIPCSTQ